MSGNSYIDVDYLIVGAGLLGSSVAMHLAQLSEAQGPSICCLDADLAGKLSSSELNAGGVRATWNNPLNVALSKDSIQFFREHKSAFGFEESGYLFLITAKDWDSARRRMELLTKQGVVIEELDQASIQGKAPFIDKLEDVAGGTFSPGDGLLNPNLVKNFYRSECRSRGVLFKDGHRVTSVTREGSFFIVTCQVVSPGDDNSLHSYLSGTGSSLERESAVFRARNIVNCAGAWAGRLAKLIGYQSEVSPLRRQISIFQNKAVDMRRSGMIVDTSGVYFHPEADNILAGFADPAEKYGFNLDYDGTEFFEEKIWLPLYNRSSKFESLKHITGWGGLYAMTPDHSAAIGRAPGCENVFEACGFSGRGAMQSYAAGRGLAELIATGKYQTIDLRPFAGSRFKTGEWIEEGLLI